MSVYYNWGRWVIHCSSPDCVGATLLSLDTRRGIAICECRDTTICSHGAICATPIPVLWPDNAKAIVAVTAERPVMNRNWYPSETVADLEAENLEHGAVVT